MERKVVNDAVAYIRGLATLRGRNADWAEATVREAANLPAAEALERNVIDLIAEDLDALLAALDGRTIAVDGASVTLALEDAEIHTVVPDWRDELLALISEPERRLHPAHAGSSTGSSSSSTIPGLARAGRRRCHLSAAGRVCAANAADQLRRFGADSLRHRVMVAEVVTPTSACSASAASSHSSSGSIMLFDSELPGYRVSLPLVAAVAVTSAAIFMLGLGAAARARRLRVSTGREAMLGAPAVALEDFAERGRVRAFSENWLARSPRPVRKGDNLRVTAIDGLVLTVRPDAGIGCPR